MRVLTIAGWDGCGGAGIQADLKVFWELGCEGWSVLTALPVQNEKGVRSVYPVNEQCVREQLRTVSGLRALKMGMLHRAEVVEAVADELPEVPVVIDPVIRSSSGHELLSAGGVEQLKQRLLPRVTVLTPNLPEASVLLGRPVTRRDQMEKAGRDLTAMGPKAVVMKGGHLDGSCDDCLCVGDKVYWFSAPRIEVQNTHGTGCTFSAAITAYLAQGKTVPEAVERAKKFLTLHLEKRRAAAMSER